MFCHNFDSSLPGSMKT